MELKFLIVTQIGVDILIAVFLIFLVRRLRSIRNSVSVDKPAEIFESLLRDADKMAGRFKGQLEEKHRLIKSLNEQLDTRIVSLNILLNRADVLLSLKSEKGDESRGEPVSITEQRTKIIELANKGNRAEKIAHMLSIPKGEVKLVLDLRMKLSQMGSKESVS